MSWKHVAIRGCPCTVHDIAQQIVQLFYPNLSFSAYLPLSHRTSFLTVLQKEAQLLAFLCLKDQTFRMMSLLSKVAHRLISCACTHMCTLMSPSSLPRELCTLPLPLANSNSPFSLFLLHMQPQERTEQARINTNTIHHVRLRDCISCWDPCPSTLCGHQGRFRQMVSDWSRIHVWSIVTGSLQPCMDRMKLLNSDAPTCRFIPTSLYCKF